MYRETGIYRGRSGRRPGVVTRWDARGDTGGIELDARGLGFAAALLKTNWSSRNFPLVSLLVVLFPLLPLFLSSLASLPIIRPFFAFTSPVPCFNRISFSILSPHLFLTTPNFLSFHYFPSFFPSSLLMPGISARACACVQRGRVEMSYNAGIWSRLPWLPPLPGPKQDLLTGLKC